MENKSNSTADRELLLTRTINAPVELVWEAWSSAEHIASWWGPSDFTTTINTMDLRPGGAWLLVLHGPDGTDYGNECIFREVVLQKKIVYEHVNYPHFMATVEFEEQGDKTLLSWHMLFDSREDFLEVAKKHKIKAGQKQNVDKLEAYLAAMK